MTLQDALRSGKRFRRTGRTGWVNQTYSLELPAIDILADDWEVEEVYYKVTEEELQRLHFLGGCIGLGPVMNPFDGTEAKAFIDRIKARGPVTK